MKILILTLVLLNLSLLSKGSLIDRRRTGSQTHQPNELNTRADEDQEQGGCVTNDGRPGSCVMERSCQTVKDTSNLPVCYSLFWKFICCPNSEKPARPVQNLQGNYHGILIKFCLCMIL